jgi:hypothetical protein
VHGLSPNVQRASPQKRGPTTVGSHIENPSAVGSGGHARSLASGGGACRRNDLRCLILDHGPDNHQICGSCTTFSSRDIGHREIGVLEVMCIGTPIVAISRRGSRPSVG